MCRIRSTRRREDTCRANIDVVSSIETKVSVDQTLGRLLTHPNTSHVVRGVVAFVSEVAEIVLKVRVYHHFRDLAIVQPPPHHLCTSQHCPQLEIGDAPV